MSPKNAKAQHHINQIQAVYQQWLELQQKLKTHQQDWARAAALMAQMNAFYFEGQWREIYEKIEAGADLDLTTDGEYSVMSEDTLWNAFHDYEALLWENLRFAIKALDPNND